jgi:hypothetical protein
MIFVTDKQISSNLKKAGFSKVDAAVYGMINKASFTLVKNTLEKAAKKAVLKGGRIVLPTEYYGVSSGSFVAESTGTDMTVNQDLIRPSFTAQLNGGAPFVFKLGMSTTKNMCSEVITTSAIEVIVRESAVKKIHNKLVARLTELVHACVRKSKGTNELTADVVNTVMKMKKFADMA